MLRKFLGFIVLAVSTLSANATVYFTWDFDQPVNNVSSTQVIEMWATLTISPSSTESITVDFSTLTSMSSSGTLLDLTDSGSDPQPYTWQFASGPGPVVGEILLAPGDSQQFIFGILVPKAGITPGTYSNVNVLSLGFDLSADADSEFVVNVSSVPVPAAAWLFGSALIGLVGLKRKR